MHGWYSRVGSNQEQIMMAHIRYVAFMKAIIVLKINGENTILRQ